MLLPSKNFLIFRLKAESIRKVYIYNLSNCAATYPVHMIFHDLLNQKFQQLKPDFDKLLEEALKRQTHPADLLLVTINGVYDYNPPFIEELGGQMMPFKLGPDREGISFTTHHEFMGKFIEKNIISDKDYKEYTKEVEWSADRQEEIDNLRDGEAYTIQMEMLLYLKMWESDAFIKQLYQLVQLTHGKDYDWHFKIDNNEKVEGEIVTGKREEIIRKKVRDKTKKSYPNLYSALKNAFVSQLRNAIAHSQYSLFGSHIQLNNYKEGSKGSPFPAFSFDEWTNKFHDSLVIYSLVGHLINRVNELYSELAKETDNLLSVRAKRIIREGEKFKHIAEEHLIQYNPDQKRWRWFTPN